MLRELPTLVVVTVVAVFIWAFAETETLRQRELMIELAYQPAESSLYMEVLEGPAPTPGKTVRVEVTLEGAVGAVDEIERLFRQPFALFAGPGDAPLEAGDQTIDFRSVLRENAEVRRRGVTIKKVDPPSMLVRVDTMVEREVPLRFDAGSLELETAAEIKPPRVTLRLPARDATGLNENSYATCVLDAAAASRLVPGRKETISALRVVAPSTLASASRVTCVPAQADVSFTLRRRTASVTLPSVPVHVQLAAGEQPNWEIRIDAKDQFLTDVKVTGPSDVVKQIEEKKLPVVAILQLSFTELEGGKLTAKDVVFSNMPTSLTFEAANKTVNFTATRKTSNGGAAKPNLP
jgi:hypothetical protein